MEHHQCFQVYITRTRATHISNMVHFKHQYITNPAILLELHVVAATQQLATALKCNIPPGNKTAEALTRVSKLFTKIASAKNELAKAKEQCDKQQANTTARKCTRPRVEPSCPRVEVKAVCPWVEAAAQWVTTTHTGKRGNTWTPSNAPHYIAQDKEDEPTNQLTNQQCPTR